MVGWMIQKSSPSVVLPARRSLRVQVRPRSGERSKWARQAGGSGASSMLEPASRLPSARVIGLFLIGPRMPSGSRRGSLQVRPSAADSMTIPHHSGGLGPTL